MNPEPRNPLYLLLLVVGVVFVVTALNYALLPEAADAADSAFAARLRRDGAVWLLAELALLILLGLASMALDRARLLRLKNDDGKGTMPEKSPATSTAPEAADEEPLAPDRRAAQADQPP